MQSASRHIPTTTFTSFKSETFVQETERDNLSPRIFSYLKELVEIKGGVLEHATFGSIKIAAPGEKASSKPDLSKGMTVGICRVDGMPIKGDTIHYKNGNRDVSEIHIDPNGRLNLKHSSIFHEEFQNLREPAILRLLVEIVEESKPFDRNAFLQEMLKVDREIRDWEAGLFARFKEVFPKELAFLVKKKGDVSPGADLHEELSTPFHMLATVEHLLAPRIDAIQAGDDEDDLALAYIGRLAAEKPSDNGPLKSRLQVVLGEMDLEVLLQCYRQDFGLDILDTVDNGPSNYHKLCARLQDENPKWRTAPSPR